MLFKTKLIKKTDKKLFLNKTRKLFFFQLTKIRRILFRNKPYLYKEKQRNSKRWVISLQKKLKKSNFFKKKTQYKTKIGRMKKSLYKKRFNKIKNPSILLEKKFNKKIRLLKKIKSATGKILFMKFLLLHKLNGLKTVVKTYYFNQKALGF